ncbi:MAG: efflux RND transporter permease subunit [Vallitaleaceae bacterium]|nr:efflux RND transporter permease subunit [Vallitaleaceae bacterium]
MIKSVIINRKILLLFILLVFLLGTYSYYHMPKQESPNVTPSVAIITTIYPGASQENVERLVTSKIEDEIKTLEGYSFSISYSNNSVSTIILEIEYGSDTDKAWAILGTKMQQLQSDLPPECHDILIKTNLAETTGIIIALSGENYTYEELGEYGERIMKRLADLQGVTRFELMGDITREVQVTVDHNAFNRLGLSYQDLIELLRSQNLEIPSGLIENASSKIALNITGSFESLEEIENIVIGMSDTDYSVLRLKDIATVAMVERDNDIRYKDNGYNAILLSGYFKQDENVLNIGKEVRANLESIKKDMPKDLMFKEVIFQPEDVEMSLNTFMMNLLQGIILVILVVFVGMGFRNAIIVSTAIPLAIIMTFIIMPLVDTPIHQVSIIALIVALGMLVDNAIVVSDSIQNKLDEGMDRLTACESGSKEVLIPVFTSTLTTIATLSPLLFLNSIVGDYIIGLPLVVIIALISSFVIAVFVTPVLAYMFFKPSKNRKEHAHFRFGYKMLDRMMHHKVLSVISVIAIIALLGSTLLFLEVIFFPKADKNIMYVDIVSEKIIDLETTEAISDQVEAILAKEDGVISYTTAIGGGIPKFFTAMNIYTQLPQNAQIMFRVDLSQTSFPKNTPYAEYLQAKIDESLLGGKATVKELENAFPSEAPIALRFTGSDFDRINDTVSEVKAILENIEGTKNVRTDYDGKKLEYEIKLNQNELSYLGLLKYDVLNEVSIALRGREASTYRSEGKEYDIRLRSSGKQLSDIENLMIKSSISGHKYLLKDIGSIGLVEKQPTIKKYKGDYTISLYSDIYLGYQRPIILETLYAKLSDVDFEDVSYSFDGEAELIQENFGSAGSAAVFAVFAIYLILLFQFKDMRQPFIVLITVPLSSAGALFGLFLMNQPISFTGLIGIISLIGIVVNNAIVLIDYINIKCREGKSIEEAAKEASGIRLRPIVLSTVTTISGLIPLLLSNSELFKPMAVALVFGLLVSTLLTLVFIPLMYTILIPERSVDVVK